MTGPDPDPRDLDLREAGTSEFTTEALAAQVIRAAVRRGLSLGTAESLTGGALAAALVSAPGASAAFEGAVVSYSHAVKTRVLGVDAGLLERTGAVDPDVAEAMADGARTALGVDLAVSTTGVAGPEPHDGQPVGTVHLGLAGPDGVRRARLQLSWDREQIRSRTVRAALLALMGVLEHSQ